MNDETALKELLTMCRIYKNRGQADKAQECMVLVREIQNRLLRNDQMKQAQYQGAAAGERVGAR